MAGALILLALGTEFICSSICKAFEEVIFSAEERIFFLSIGLFALAAQFELPMECVNGCRHAMKFNCTPSAN